MSAKRDQILHLDPPNELRFRGPFTDVVTSYLKLTNPSENRVCFKVKTTAPKRYCVRPNNGIVEPRAAVDVQVMLQPFDYDPNEKNKHKFMVQTMFAPEGDVNQENLWKDINPEHLMDSKLKCVFELPAADSSAQNNLDATLPLADEKSHTAKSMEMPKGSKSGSSVEMELKRATEEVKLLEKENAALRQENIQLKEEGLRLRRHQHQLTGESSPAGVSSTSEGGGGGGGMGGGVASSSSSSTSSSLTASRLLHSFPNDPSNNNNIAANPPSALIYLMLGVAAVLFGLILGKIF